MIPATLISHVTAFARALSGPPTSEVRVHGIKHPVQYVGPGRSLKMLSNVRVGTRTFTLIEQNPNKPSRWGKLSREGHQVIQVTDGNRYVGVVVDGHFQNY